MCRRCTLTDSGPQLNGRREVARAFQVGSGGLIVAHLEQQERELLAFLLDELANLVAPAPTVDGTDLFEHLQAQWESAPVAVAGDPVLSRLFPDAFPDDEQSSADFRRFTEQNLRQLRTNRIAELRALLDTSDIRLTVDQGHAVLQVLTDLRLVLGVRLGIRDESPRPPSQGVALDVYDWLTWLQESLVQALFQLPGRS